jgi:hypothetical protein
MRLSELLARFKTLGFDPDFITSDPEVRIGMDEEGGDGPGFVDVLSVDGAVLEDGILYITHALKESDVDDANE